MNVQTPALRRRLADIVEEYDAKRAAIPEALAAYGRAVSELSAAASIGAAYGGPLLRDSSGPAPFAMEAALLKSAWAHVFDGLNIAEVASAADKRRFEQMLEAPPALHAGRDPRAVRRLPVEPAPPHPARAGGSLL